MVTAYLSCAIGYLPTVYNVSLQRYVPAEVGLATLRLGDKLVAITSWYSVLPLVIEIGASMEMPLIHCITIIYSQHEAAHKVLLLLHSVLK